MKCILYCSHAKLNTIDIDALLKAAVIKNARLGITGFLISHAAGFIQYIEGEEQPLDELYAAIKQDHRHSNITTLFDGQISARLYQEWQMGHVYIDSDDVIEKLLKTDKLQWFEYLKQRALFLSPHKLSQPLAVEDSAVN